MLSWPIAVLTLLILLLLLLVMLGVEGGAAMSRAGARAGDTVRTILGAVISQLVSFDVLLRPTAILGTSFSPRCPSCRLHSLQLDHTASTLAVDLDSTSSGLAALL